MPRLATSAQLARLPSGGEVAVAGLVIARQRPGTANGTMFLLFEDEFGTVNLIVPRAVYERHRQLARAEPLLLARGRLERHQQGAGGEHLGSSAAASAARAARLARANGEPAPPRVDAGEADEEIRPVINVIVRELAPLERFLSADHSEGREGAAAVTRLPGSERVQQAELEEDQLEGGEIGSSMRAVAPPVQSFAAGRRR